MINICGTEILDKLESLPKQIKEQLRFIHKVVFYKCDGKMVKLSYDKVQELYKEGLTSKQHQNYQVNGIKALNDQKRLELFYLSTFYIKVQNELEKTKERKKPPNTLQENDIARLINNVIRTQQALIGKEKKDKRYNSDFVEV